MSLIAGQDLLASHFFSEGEPRGRGSSFDLTIGTIFDHLGRRIEGSFILEPGQMVQVVSKEVFRLPRDVTGHVTYKTALTKKGIWALTVGIVDPGWSGPVSTTLLNFSKVDHAVMPDSTFLRVSFFKHACVTDEMLPKIVSAEDYRRDVERDAMTKFARTFLNQDEVARKAGEAVLDRIRKEALVWVASIAVLFTIINLILKNV